MRPIIRAMISRADARLLFDRLTAVKARHLVMIEGEVRYARSPFPYDKRFFKHLRKDQVPRFLRCLTDPEKLPTRVFELGELWAIQNRVDLDKVEALQNSPTPSLPVVVKTDEHLYIVDGLHRMSADWLSDRDAVVAHYCDLTEKTQRVEAVPGSGKFNVAEERAREASV